MQFVKANVNNLSAASEPGMLSNNENIFSNAKLVRAGKYRFQPASKEKHYIAELAHFKVGKYPQEPISESGSEQLP